MNQIPRLIGICGKMGAGKSTLAKTIVENHRYVEESFAMRPKKGIQAMFNLTYDQVFGDITHKNAPIKKMSRNKEVTPRLLMQTGMTDWARDMIDPDIWIWPVQDQWELMSKISGFAGMVISDLRFQNEAEWIKSAGGTIVKVVDNSDYYDYKTDFTGHVSEEGIPESLIDRVVLNDRESKDSLYRSFSAQITRPPMPAVKPPKPEQSVKDLVVEWADSVFPNRTITNALSKLVMHEIPEYLMAQNDPLELADLGILLYDIANLAGVDLDDAIRQKIEINKKRKWKLDEETGLMSHVPCVQFISEDSGEID